MIGCPDVSPSSQCCSWKVNSPKPFDQFLEDEVPMQNYGVGGRSSKVTSFYLTKVMLNVALSGVWDGENRRHCPKKDGMGLSGRNSRLLSEVQLLIYVAFQTQ